MSEILLVQRKGDTVTLLLNRPACSNALSHQLLTELADALGQEIGLDISKIIISGRGKCFSAGADFRELNGTIDDLWIDDDIARVTELIRASPVPVIALVNGPCMGGAVDIALSCDQRIAEAGAYFQVPATKLGLLYNPPSVKRMVERYGMELVSRLLVDGECFDAGSALAVGMVTRVNGSGGGIAIEARPESPSSSRATIATRDMIEAIDQGRFDSEHWEQVRREILNSPERSKAIAAVKNRIQSKQD